MKLTYRYRLYPNKTQERALNAMMFHSKRLYNIARIERIFRYQVNGESLSWQTQSKTWVTQGRKVDEGFSMLAHDTACYVLQRLHKAYQNFFRRVKNGDEQKGFPRHMRFCNTLEFKYPSGIKFHAVDVDRRKKKAISSVHDVGNWTTLYVMNVGDVRVRYHRALPDEGRISYASVTVDRHRRWHVQLVVDEPDIERPATGNIVGIDVGLKYALALSDGTTFDPPRHYEATLRELRVLNRKLDRQRRANNPDCYDEKGRAIPGKRPVNVSNRMRKTYDERKRLLLTVAEQRKDWLHNVTHWLTETYDFIAIEDLSPQFMLQNKRLALKAADLSIGMFRQMIEYKSEARGVVLVPVPAAYTSQECHVCGHVSKENRTTQAKFLCQSCGHNENADIQAAKNILKRGLEQFNARAS